MVNRDNNDVIVLVTLSPPNWIRPLILDWNTVFPNGDFVSSTW